MKSLNWTIMRLLHQQISVFSDWIRAGVPVRFGKLHRIWTLRLELSGPGLAAILLTGAIIGTGCEDPRPTQREDNIFDPENAFIRFNYDNQVNEPAKDSVVLSATAPEDSALVIPVALSAAPQPEAVQVRLEAEVPDSLGLGTLFTINGEDGESALGRNLAIPPGSFDYELIYNRLDTLPAPGRLQLRLESITPDFIHLGFPGSGRGRTFELIFQE